MPILIKLLLKHAAIGFAVAASFVFGLLSADMGGVGSLIAASDSGPLALFLLTFFLGLTFASAQMGFAIMLRDWNEPDQGRRQKSFAIPHWPEKTGQLLPVRVRPHR